MKQRTFPHPSVSNSVPLEEEWDRHSFLSEHFGAVRRTARGWIQERITPQGLNFRLCARGGAAESWHWQRWVEISALLDDLIDEAFRCVPLPCECPDELDCDSVLLSSVKFDRDSIQLVFSGDYSKNYHEYLLAIFKDNEPMTLEWTT
jgi:hypothetical protein